MNQNELRNQIEELVWHAWSLGMLAGNPNTPVRRSDELHREVHDELNRILEELNDD